MRANRKAKLIIVITSGTVIKAPEIVKTATGKVMAMMTIHAESDKRSSYPLKIVAFDINALEMMTCQKGDKVAATGRYEWFNGYQLTRGCCYQSLPTTIMPSSSIK